MLASDLIKQLQEIVAEEGDFPVVSGLSRTGYGEPVTAVFVDADRVIDHLGGEARVIELELSEDSSFAKGSW